MINNYCDTGETGQPMRQTALHIGIRNGDYDFVKAFLTSLHFDNTINFGLRDSDGTTPLGLAIADRNFDIAEELIKGSLLFCIIFKELNN